MTNKAEGGFYPNNTYHLVKETDHKQENRPAGARLWSELLENEMGTCLDWSHQRRPLEELKFKSKTNRKKVSACSILCYYP